MNEKDNDLVVSQIANATPPGFGKLRLKTRIRRDKERRLLKGEWVDSQNDYTLRDLLTGISDLSNVRVEVNWQDKEVSILPEAAAQRPDIDTIIPALT